MKGLARWTVIGVILSVVWVQSLRAQGVTNFRLHSERDDPLGAGLNYSAYPADGTQNLLPWDGAGLMGVFLWPLDPGSDMSWTFEFSRSDGAPLTTGTYRDQQITVRSYQNYFPTAGVFVVREVSYDAMGLQTSAWVTFVEYANGGSAALYGDFRYNAGSNASAGPIVDAGPDQQVSSGLAVLNGKVWEFVGEKGGGVRPPAHWSVVSGPGPVKFADASSTVTTASVTQTGTYVFRLTGGAGKTSSSADTTVTYSAQSTSLYVVDGTQGGAVRFHTPADGSLSARMVDGGLEVDRQYAYYADAILYFSVPGGKSLTTGTYSGATQAKAYPGLSGSTPTLLYSSPEDGSPGFTTGSFVIKELAVDPGNNITSLWATFAEYAGGASSPTISGEIRVNAHSAGVIVPGSYEGLATSPDYQPGSAKLTLNSSGAFTGAFDADYSRHHVIKGVISPASTSWCGLASSSPSLGVLKTTLQINADGTLCGQACDDGNYVTTMLLKPAAPASTFAALVGSYTLALTPPGPNFTGPTWGYGIGLATVDTHGSVRIVGSLPDGNDLGAGAKLACDGSIRFFRTYRKTGSVSGWVQFANLPDSDFTGSLDWEYNRFNVPLNQAVSTTLSLTGSRWNSGYILPSLSAGIPNAEALFTDDNWDAPMTLQLDIGTKIKVQEHGITTAWPHPGLWIGAFADPAHYGVDAFAAVFIQKKNMGYGLFRVYRGSEPGIYGQAPSFHPVTITPK